MVYIFANGKGVRTPLKVYETKGNYKKLKNAFSTAAPLVGIFYEKENEPFEIMMVSDNDRAIVFKSSMVPLMATKGANGNILMTLGRRETRVAKALTDFADLCGDGKGYRKTKLPATGLPLGDRNNEGEQLSITDNL